MLLVLILTACVPAVDPGPTPLPVSETAIPPTNPPASPTTSPPPTATATPTPPPQPTLAPPLIPSLDPTCDQDSGELSEASIDSRYLPRPLQVTIYLPPCYDPDSQAGYPLLTLLHGQSDTPDQWLRIGLPETVDRLILAGQIPPLIIALPYEQYSLQNPFGTGFESAVPEEMLPWMAAHYPLCEQRDCRAIGGISRGGAWALHLGFTRWELFSAIGAHSAPLFFGSDRRLPEWLEAIPADQQPRLALDVGDRDHLYRSIEELHLLLESLGVAHAWQVSPGMHEDAYWSSHLEEYLRWYGEGLQQAAASAAE